MIYVTTAKPKYIKVQNDKEGSYFVSQVIILIEDYIHSDEFVFLSYIAWEFRTASLWLRGGEQTDMLICQGTVTILEKNESIHRIVCRKQWHCNTTETWGSSRIFISACFFYWFWVILQLFLIVTKDMVTLLWWWTLVL